VDEPLAAPASRSLWRNRDYRWLWGGQAVSSLGTGISQFAFPLLILVLTGSPAATGFAAALGRAPYLFFSLPAGALVDHWNRKRVLLICTVGLLLSVGSVPVALVARHLTVFQVYLVVLLMGSFAACYDLAELAALTHLVPKAQLPTAVTQNEAVYSSVSLLAPSLGGVLFSLGRLFPFVADAASYLVLFFSLLKIRRPLQDAPAPGEHQLLRAVHEGLRWLWSQRHLRVLAVLAAYLEILLTGSVLIVLVIAKRHGISAALLGAILAIGGVGNLLGTFLSVPLQRRVPFGPALSALLVLFLVVWPFYGFAPAPWFLATVVAGWSLIDSLAAIQIESYQLTSVPGRLQGRVSSAYRLLIFGSLTVSQAMIGLGLQYWGVLPTIGALWAGLALVALGVLLQPHLRQATLPSG
jgi:predicted MFS family arabinose efflux permease